MSQKKKYMIRKNILRRKKITGPQKNRCHSFIINFSFKTDHSCKRPPPKLLLYDLSKSWRNCPRQYPTAWRSDRQSHWPAGCSCRTPPPTLRPHGLWEWWAGPPWHSPKSWSTCPPSRWLAPGRQRRGIRSASGECCWCSAAEPASMSLCSRAWDWGPGPHWPVSWCFCQWQRLTPC